MYLINTLRWLQFKFCKSIITTPLATSIGIKTIGYLRLTNDQIYILSLWYEICTFLKCSDFESEHTNGKLRIIQIHWCNFYDLTPNGLCAMISRSLLILALWAGWSDSKKRWENRHLPFFWEVKVKILLLPYPIDTLDRWEWYK